MEIEGIGTFLVSSIFYIKRIGEIIKKKDIETYKKLEKMAREG